MADEMQYLTDGYREMLADLVENDPHVSQREAEERFVQKCKEISRFMKDGTPPSAIRSVSFSVIESEL